MIDDRSTEPRISPEDELASTGSPGSLTKDRVSPFKDPAHISSLAKVGNTNAHIYAWSCPEWRPCMLRGGAYMDAPSHTSAPHVAIVSHAHVQHTPFVDRQEVL